jgi:hypothetical protein
MKAARVLPGSMWGMLGTTGALESSWILCSVTVIRVTIGRFHFYG